MTTPEFDTRAKVSLSAMLENLFMALAKHVESDSEAAVGRLRAGDRLEKKVDRCSAIQGGHLRCDVAQTTGLRRNLVDVQ